MSVDQYLWSVYERTPKLDTVKSEERVSVSVKKKGKQGNVTRTVTKFMDENFTWKDPHATQKVGMSTMDYVVGGMDHDLKLRLYRLLRALDDSSELAMLVTARLRRPTHTLVQRRLLANFSDQFDRGGVETCLLLLFGQIFLRVVRAPMRKRVASLLPFLREPKKHQCECIPYLRIVGCFRVVNRLQDVFLR